MLNSSNSKENLIQNQLKMNNSHEVTPIDQGDFLGEIETKLKKL